MALIGSTLVSIVLLTLSQANLGEGSDLEKQIEDLSSRLNDRTKVLIRKVGINLYTIRKLKRESEATASSIKVKHEQDIDRLSNEVNALKTAAEKQAGQTEEKSPIDFPMPAFSVTSKVKMTPAPNRILVLPDVILKIGPGYDEKTGVFTAPVNGLYSFNFCVMSIHKCEFRVKLMMNDKTLVSSFSYDKDTWTQASISSIAELRAEDQVFLNVGDNGCTLEGGSHTVFNGHLVHAL